MFTKEKEELINKRQINLMHKNTGFTLLELIIVMAILAILVTLALLYYGNVTDAAYRDALLADLNQIDKAIALYEKEYNSLPMVETAPVALDDQIDAANGNVPAIINENNGAITAYTVSRSNMNLNKYLKKTTFIFKGNESGDIRGAGMLYYVDTANSLDTGTVDVAEASDTVINLADDGRADDYYNNCEIYITSGTGVGQSRTITDFDSSDDTATISTDWITRPDTTSDYEIRPPVKRGDLIFVQSATTDRLIIKDEAGNAIYKY